MDDSQLAEIGIKFNLNAFPRKKDNNNHLRLQPYHENSYYWQYKGVLLILHGASNHRNIFQHPDMVEELGNMQAENPAKSNLCHWYLFDQ